MRFVTVDGERGEHEGAVAADGGVSRASTYRAKRLLASVMVARRSSGCRSARHRAGCIAGPREREHLPEGRCLHSGRGKGHCKSGIHDVGTESDPSTAGVQKHEAETSDVSAKVISNLMQLTSITSKEVRDRHQEHVYTKKINFETVR